MEEHKVAIIITTCDAYRDCWKPMIKSLDSNWSDCEYSRYIITNYAEDSTIPNTTFVKVGDDKRSWCTLALKGLEQIDAEYVIFFQEDYWLGKQVNNEAIKSHIDYMDNNGLDYLKLSKDFPRDKYRIGSTNYCLNPINERYTLNTAIAIWRKSTFQKFILQDGWDGWKFERNIVPYINDNKIHIKSQTIYSPLVDALGITSIKDGAIVRGVWSPAATEFLKANGYFDTLKGRPVMGPITAWLYSMDIPATSIRRYPFWGALKILKALKLNW